MDAARSNIAAYETHISAFSGPSENKHSCRVSPNSGRIIRQIKQLADRPLNEF